MIEYYKQFFFCPQLFLGLTSYIGENSMKTELRYCSEGDYIKATFLGNRDPEDPNDLNWHRIYALESKSNGRYYAAIEGWGSSSDLYGSTEVERKD